jgi:hypothetical protein
VVILFLYCPGIKDAEYFLFKVPELVSCNSISRVFFAKEMEENLVPSG